jgi:hypothetical protein
VERDFHHARFAAFHGRRSGIACNGDDEGNFDNIAGWKWSVSPRFPPPYGECYCANDQPMPGAAITAEDGPADLARNIFPKWGRKRCHWSGAAFAGLSGVTLSQAGNKQWLAALQARRF